MLPRFFKRGVVVANYAESGESLRSSLASKRVAKVESLVKAGDYVMIQFGHNDMKDKSEGALQRYESSLRALVKSIQARGAVPVLITSMERKAGITKDTLEGYPDTVRRVAEDEKTALIDLHSMSRTLYVALGSDLDAAFQDGTHHSNFGSDQLARCVVRGIRSAGLPIAQMLVADAPAFDPVHPDTPADFSYAVSPLVDPKKPDGN
jgi:lysophospholipase L1-like esterase